MESQKNLSHCAGIFQFFGLLYFPVKLLNTSDFKRFPTRRYTFYFFIIFLLITALTSHFAISITNEPTDSLSARTALSYIMQHLLFALMIIVLVIAFIQSYLATPKLKKIFHNMTKFSEFCELNFNLKADYNAVKINLFKFFVKFLVSNLFSHVVLILYGAYHNLSYAFKSGAIGFIPITFLGMILVKFYFLTSTINYQLQIIHALLRNTLQRRNIFIQVMPKKLFMTLNPFEIQLKYLMKVYILVYENSLLINRTMGITILAQVLICVLTLISGGYKVLLTLLGKFEVSRIGGIILGSLVSIVILNILVYSCERIKKSVSSRILEEQLTFS